MVVQTREALEEGQRGDEADGGQGEEEAKLPRRDYNHGQGKERQDEEQNAHSKEQAKEREILIRQDSGKGEKGIRFILSTLAIKQREIRKHRTRFCSG